MLLSVSHHAVSLDWATFVVEKGYTLRLGNIYFKVGCSYTWCMKEPQDQQDATVMYFGYYNSVVFIEKSETMSSWMKTQSKRCVVCETNTLSAFAS